MSFLSFLFGNKDKRILRQTNDLVASINLLEKKFEELDSEELKNTTQRLKNKLADGKKLDNLIPEAFIGFVSVLWTSIILISLFICFK